MLLTVGLLEPEYELGLQVETLAAMREKLPRAGLIIAGAGSLETELRNQIAAAAHRDHVLLYGDMPHPVTLRAIARSGALMRTTR